MDDDGVKITTQKMNRVCFDRRKILRKNKTFV